MSVRSLLVADLGTRDYGEVLQLQRSLCRAVIAGQVPGDLLLLVEHPDVVTLGRGTRASSVPVPAADLERRGYAVYDVERGGDVTYHGPGQLVGYPIVDLRRHREDLHWYLRRLEGGLIDALAALGIPAEAVAELTGVWTRGRKIASIGIHVKQWVTFHGFALNVTTALERFDAIVPCGIPDVVMTSVAREWPGAPPADLHRRALQAVVAALAATFSWEVAAIDASDLTPWADPVTTA